MLVHRAVMFRRRLPFVALLWPIGGQRATFM
jgi:hypothetical protein